MAPVSNPLLVAVLSSALLVAPSLHPLLGAVAHARTVKGAAGCAGTDLIRLPCVAVCGGEAANDAGAYGAAICGAEDETDAAIVCVPAHAAVDGVHAPACAVAACAVEDDTAAAAGDAGS